MLRSDLKAVKREHFMRHFRNQIQKPENNYGKFLNPKHPSDRMITAGDKYEIKYFLEESQRKRVEHNFNKVFEMRKNLAVVK